jgi:predicted metal-dependent phosphoesterase TrpH
MLIDLQLHSTYSDGYLTPTKLVEFIAMRGIKIAALTDHNTVGGLDEFRLACKKYKIKSITGLELYVKLGHKKFNILWFNFDDKNPDLHNLLRYSQIRRRNKVRIILKKLIEAGYKINHNKIIDKYSHYIPINRLTDEIYSIGHNRAKTKKKLKIFDPREEEIIREYFFNKEIGILRETHLDIKRVLKLRKKIGGQIIYNHPAKYDYVKRNFLEKLKKLKIDGIEILSPHHSVGAVMFLQSMAEKFRLIETGGSDFHKFEETGGPIKNSWDYFKVDSKHLSEVNKIIG